MKPPTGRTLHWGPEQRRVQKNRADMVNEPISEFGITHSPSADFPDPFVLMVGTQFYAYATNSGGYNVQVLHSTDLVHWRRLGDALPELPSWAAKGRSLTWAPVVLSRGDRYVLYYTARYEKAELQCISCAVSQKPSGPFIDPSVEPLLCQHALGGSIDPSPFVEADERIFLLWKNDGNSCGLPTGLWIQPLRSDGLAMEGMALELLQADQPWEQNLIEAPALVKHEGQYTLFYSGNWWESAEYAIGYAISDTLMGTYHKPLSRPWFSGDGNALGPGGQEFFTDTRGQLWMVYHAWTPPHVKYPHGVRGLHLARIHFENGRPVAEPSESEVSD